MTTSSKGKKAAADPVLARVESTASQWNSNTAAAEASTLDDLLGAFGPVSDEAIEAELGRISQVRLETLGRRKDSPAILAALPAFVVSAALSWQQLPAEARWVLVGFDPRALAMVVTLGVRLRETYRAFVGQSSTFEAELERRRSQARAAFDRGMNLRDQAVRAMRRELADGEDARAALEARKGVAETAEALALGLEGVAAEVETRLADEGRAEALAAKSITPAYVTRLREAAEQVRKTDAAAAGAAASVVTKAKLDEADGRVLWLVDGVWRAFLDAAEIDPRVRVPKIGRLEDAFVRKAGKKADVETEPKPEG